MSDDPIPTPATILPVEPVKVPPKVYVEHDWRPKAAQLVVPPHVGDFVGVPDPATGKLKETE